MIKESKLNPDICSFDTAYARRARLTTEALLQGKWRIEIFVSYARGWSAWGNSRGSFPTFPRRF